MERFQRNKYLGQVAGIRRELEGWEGTYRTMLQPENLERFTSRQLTVAGLRSEWLPELIEKLEELEEAFDQEPDE